MAAKLGNPPELRARALTLRGSSYRTIGQLDLADESFDSALEIYRNAGTGRKQLSIDEADLHRRRAYLRMEQGRLDEAWELARRSAVVFAAAGSSHDLGRADSARGLIELKQDRPEAIATIGQALRRIDTTKNVNDFHAAAHNLVLALARFEPDPALLEGAFEHLRDTRLSDRSLRPSRRQKRKKQVMGQQQRTVPDAKTRYLQGILLLRLGRDDEARRFLESAREDLTALGLPLDVAAVSIELAECYLWLAEPHRWRRVERLATEALQLLTPIPESAEAVAAYQLLVRAARERSEPEIRRQLEKCRESLGD